MFKFFWKNIIIVIGSLFSSCSLEGSILEKFFFKKNQSGNYSITVDLKKYSTVINLVERIEGKVNDFSEAMYTFFSNAAEKIRQIRDIQNITLTYNEKLSHFTLYFEFNNLKALNNALILIGEYITEGDLVSLKNNNHQFIRRLPNFANVFAIITKDKKSTEERFGIKYFLKNLKLISIYEFENMKIRNPTSGFSKISKNHKTIVYDAFLIDMTEENTVHNIFLKKINKP